jgi:hypothetical protein
MAEELSQEEQELLAKHRAEKQKKSRKVTVKGTHKESGAEYSFDLEGDDADRVISRHRSLFEDVQETKQPAKKAASDAASGHPYFKGNKE